MDKIYEEVTFVSYYLHWDRDLVMKMEHPERQRWCKQISNIHDKMNKKEDNEISIEKLIL